MISAASDTAPAASCALRPASSATCAKTSSNGAAPTQNGRTPPSATWNAEREAYGERLYEPYVREAARYTLPVATVPAGCIFALGDNRNQSDDSHVWGPLPASNVVGKAFYILWPIERQGM